MYRRGNYKKRSYNGQYRAKRRYAPSKSKQLVTGDREPTMVEKIASGVGEVAKLASAVLPIVSAINTEMKYYEDSNSVATYGINTNASLVNLTSGIVQGVGEFDRIGQSILAKDIQLRIAMSMPMTTNATVPVLGCHHRIMILCWKDNAGQNVPSVSKILQTPNNIYSFVNKDYSDQFVVLKDKHIQFNAGLQVGTSTNGLGTQDFKSFKFYKKLDWHLRWDANNDPTQNHIYLLIMSTPSSVTNAVGSTYYSRMNFTDN